MKENYSQLTNKYSKVWSSPFVIQKSFRILSFLPWSTLKDLIKVKQRPHVVSTETVTE
jgi:hypothetical protein